VKKTCARCGSELKGDYCSKCKGKSKKKTTILILIILFIILASSFPLFENAGLYVSVKRDVFEDIPYFIVKEVNTTVPSERYICQNISFRFTTSTGNVDSVRTNVRPNLVITNLETAWGSFKVNFSYIDESKFPYDIYGGKSLSENLKTGKISYQDADFYSVNYDVLIGPSESVTVNYLTQKKDKNKKYWAIAYILEPKKTECAKKTEYMTKPENRTFTEYRQIKKTIIVREYRKASEIIGIKNYSDWIILLLLAFLIVFLLIRIRIKVKEINNN
jgi:hypothetical protein